MIFSATLSALLGHASGNGAGSVPHGDAAAQDALNGASIKAIHNGGRHSCSSQFLQKVESLFLTTLYICKKTDKVEMLQFVMILYLIFPHRKEPGARCSLIKCVNT